MCHPTRQKTCSQPLPQNLKEWDHQHQDLLGVPATTGPGTGTRNTTELHLRSQTWRELARMAGGSCLSFAFANWLKKFWHSPDHRPPTSQARTTRPFARKFRVRGLFALVMGTLRRQVKITEPHVECDPAPCFPAHSRRSTLECKASLTQNPKSQTPTGGGQGRRVDGHTSKRTRTTGERAPEAAKQQHPERLCVKPCPKRCGETRERITSVAETWDHSVPKESIIQRPGCVELAPVAWHSRLWVLNGDNWVEAIFTLTALRKPNPPKVNGNGSCPRSRCHPRCPPTVANTSTLWHHAVLRTVGPSLGAPRARSGWRVKLRNTPATTTPLGGQGLPGFRSDNASIRQSQTAVGCRTTVTDRICAIPFRGFRRVCDALACSESSCLRLK